MFGIYLMLILWPLSNHTYIYPGLNIYIKRGEEERLSLSPSHSYEHIPTSMATEKEKMLRGELYYAFSPELCAARARTEKACRAYNNAGEISRRKQVELWRKCA